MSQKQISIIAAIAENGAIGKNNQLLWHIPEDLKYFKQLTTGHAVIMGRKTFESIGKPLPNRQNIVITRQMQYPDNQGVVFASSLQEAVQAAQGDEVFIIGGASIYAEAMPIAQHLYITRVHANFEGDTFFPEIDENKWQVIDNKEVAFCPKSTLSYSFLVYSRRD